MDPQTELYFALSECYKEPVEPFAREVSEGVLYRLVAENFRVIGLSHDVAALHLPGPPEQVLQTLKRGYYPLFVIPPRFVLPVESVFKEWAGEDGFLSGSRDMIMGPPAVDMLRRYQEQGITIPRRFKDYPDHLALLLEYGGLLCQAESSGSPAPNAKYSLSQFVASHLDTWLETFAEQAYSRTQSPFYRAVVSATVAFIQAERQRLKVTTP